MATIETIMVNYVFNPEETTPIEMFGGDVEESAKFIQSVMHRIQEEVLKEMATGKLRPTVPEVNQMIVACVLDTMKEDGVPGSMLMGMAMKSFVALIEDAMKAQVIKAMERSGMPFDLGDL
jgi:hypothetical protein